MSKDRIPLGPEGAPDLQRLVELLGREAAAKRGEVYDPCNNPAHGGYQYITAELWAEFDRLMMNWRSGRTRR